MARLGPWKLSRFLALHKTGTEPALGALIGFGVDTRIPSPRSRCTNSTIPDSSHFKAEG